MGFCGRCGAETRDGADYCPECGAPLRAGVTPKPSGGKLIPIAALVIAAILVAAGVYYIFNDSSRPATDAYEVTFGVQDLIVHSDDGTLYNIQQDGKYYNPDTKRFDLDTPCTHAYLVLKVTVDGTEHTSRQIRVDVNSQTGVTQDGLLSLRVQNASSLSVTVFLCTSGGSVISILSGSQSQSGVSLTIDLSQRTSVLEFTGGPQPYASGNLVIGSTSV